MRIKTLIFNFRKVCPLCKRTVLPSSESEDSESEEAPLLPNNTNDNENEGKFFKKIFKQSSRILKNSNLNVNIKMKSE